MKKGILSLLIVVFMIAMLAPAAFAAGTSVVVSDVNTTPGAEVTLNVSISGNPGSVQQPLILSTMKKYSPSPQSV